MKAKDFFRHVLFAEKELKLIRAKIQHYEDLGLSISGGGMDSPMVSHSVGTSRVEAAAMGIFDNTLKLQQRAKEYVEVINRAEAIIQQIPQERYRQILTYRYLAGWSFRSISDELGYSAPKSVYHAHGFALEVAQGIIDKAVK